MQAYVLGLTFLALLAVFVALGFLLYRMDGLSPFALRSTKRLVGPARDYCAGHCRLADGTCPLAGSTEQAMNCPPVAVRGRRPADAA